MTVRGIKGIQDVVGRVKELFDYKPGQARIRLFRRDYDLIARYPNAGKMCGLKYDDDKGRITYQGAELIPDAGEPRYRQKKAA
jgi:hypothetical protein